MAQESDAVRVAREYREQLARNEDAALRRMSRYWMKMEKSLEPRFFALSQEIKDLQDSGQPVPPQLIYTRQRYLDLMAQIMEELPDYEKYAVDVITEYQIENFNLGLDDASAVIRATSPADPVWNQVGKNAVETMAGFAGNGAPLAELMRHDYGDLGVKVTDALVQGIGLGKGAYAVAKDMRDAMGMEFNRSVRIARTEINRAYRIANAEQYAKSGVVTKVLRLCYAPTACLACLELDGEECPKGVCDDHPNGKCTTVAVTIGGHYPQWQHGHDWLMEQSEADQRRIIGDGRYEMWKKDGIPLRDMVEMKPNVVWGGSPTILSEKALREKYNITGGNRMLFDVKPAPKVEPPKPVIPEFVPAKTRQEAEEFAQQFAKNVDYSKISVENCNIINETFNELATKYPIHELDKIGGQVGGRAVMSASYNTLNINRMAIGKALRESENNFLNEQAQTRKSIENIKSRYQNKKMPNDIQKNINNMEKQLKFKRWSVLADADSPLSGVVTHEYGHILSDQYFGMINREKANPNYNSNRDISLMNNKWSQVFDKARSNGDIFNLSKYGSTNVYEFFAESFAAKVLGIPLPDYISELLDEVFTNGIM